jgi:hypothetical protein
MSEETSVWNSSQKLMPPLAIGDNVRIRRGKLEGLEGEVLGLTVGYSCVLKIEGLVSGVRVVINRDAVVPIGQVSPSSS